MASVRTLWRPQSDWLALEALALEARAGMALACSYSSSDEYEAAVIEARREAGAYDGLRQQRQIAMGIAAALALLLFYFLGV